MIRRTTFAIRILLAFYVMVVLLLCFSRMDSVPAISPYFLGIPMDKIAHFVMFFPFPILVYGAVERHSKTPLKSLLFIFGVFVTGCLFAMGTEIGQYFISYRSADPNDFLADGIGMMVSSIIILSIDLYKQK